MKTISKKQKDNVVTLYQATDLEVYKIAKICDVSTASVTNILKERQIPLKRVVAFPKKNVDKAVKMYQKGYEVKRILEECQFSQNQLYLEIDARGIERRKENSVRTAGKNIHQKRDKMIELYLQGKSYSEIERELDVSYATVRRYIVQAIEDGEVEVSERYSPVSEEYLKSVAEIFVRSKQKLSIREVAKALKVDEKKLCYRVAKARCK